MSLELAVAVALAIVASLARWQVCGSDGAPLARANAVLDRARQRREGLTPSEPLHAVEWCILAVVCLAFFAWAAAPVGATP